MKRTTSERVPPPKITGSSGRELLDSHMDYVSNERMLLGPVMAQRIL